MTDPNILGCLEYREGTLVENMDMSVARSADGEEFLLSFYDRDDMNKGVSIIISREEAVESILQLLEVMDG